MNAQTTTKCNIIKVQVPNSAANAFDIIAFEKFPDMVGEDIQGDFWTTFEFMVENEEEEAMIDRFHTGFMSDI